MNLKNKKSLVAKTLKVGKKRVVFSRPMLNEIKEAITKQDVRDLVQEGAISVKNVGGRRKIENKKKKKSTGNIKKKVNKRKQEYVIMTRKLRKYVKEIKTQGKLSRDEVLDIRKKIRNRIFKSKANLQNHIARLHQ